MTAVYRPIWMDGWIDACIRAKIHMAIYIFIVRMRWMDVHTHTHMHLSFHPAINNYVLI